MSVMEHVYEEIVSPIKQMKLEDHMFSLHPENLPQSSSTPKAPRSCPSRGSSTTEDSHPGSCSSQHSGSRPFAVLVPNNNQPLIPKSKTRPLKVLQNQGQLKISAYMNFGLLTVHVVQARHLSSKQKQLCDSFVKMSLIPDDSKKCRCKTEVKAESNNPLYDEKFSFELLEEDYNKRLFISVWHKDQTSSMCEFLGSMSFGIRHLLNPKKDITGWYYLLTEEIGRKKHLQVSSKPKSQLQIKHQNIPAVNQDVWGMESLTVTLERGKHGYGFSVVEESPVKVGRVDGSSPAESAGLKPGDCIIKVNGQNVSRSQAASVAKLVKNGGEHLILEVQRLKQVSVETLDKTEFKQPSINPYDYIPMREVQNYQNYRNVPNYQNVNCNVQNYQNVNYMHTRKISEYQNRVPAYQNFRVPDYQNFRVPDYKNIDYVAMRTSHDQHDGSDADLSDIDDCKENEFSVDEGIYSLPSNLITSTPLPLLCNGYQTVQSSERRRQEAIHRLLTIEMDFIDLMHAGMQRYSRPLRHCIMSQLQHSTLFQNVEKLVTISEYHVKQMQDNMNSSDTDTSTSVSSDNGHQFIQHLCMIYQSKVNMISQAYDLYARGIAGANQALAELRKSPEFVKFIQEPQLESNQPSISAFIYRPVQHINELYQTLKEIFLNTDNQSRDFQGLKQVVEALQECVNCISNYSCVDRVLSLSSLTSSSTSEGHKSRSCSSDSSSSHPSKAPVSCSLRSMDSEVMKIQDKLVFPPNVPVFQLCKEERHLIYSGDLFKCEGNQWIKLYVMLFSDLLVETEQDRDGHLKVIHEPLNLRDLNGIEAQRGHGTEFVLHFLLRDFGTNQLKHAKLLFRAPNMEQKFTWKSLLEQKVMSVGGSLQHFSSMSDCSETGVLI